MAVTAFPVLAHLLNNKDSSDGYSGVKRCLPRFLISIFLIVCLSHLNTSDHQGKKKNKPTATEAH